MPGFLCLRGKPLPQWQLSRMHRPSSGFRHDRAFSFSAPPHPLLRAGSAAGADSTSPLLPSAWPITPVFYRITTSHQTNGDAPMPEIIISGRAVLVDAEDVALISEARWHVKNVNGKLYVCRQLSKKDGGAFELFHRKIMQCPKDMCVDHRNGVTLDCRKENLRICTHAQNMRNRAISKSNRCGFKGVYEDIKCPGIFIAQIKFEGKRYRLGRFDDPALAHAAYCVAAQKYHGEFARTA